MLSHRINSVSPYHLYPLPGEGPQTREAKQGRSIPETPTCFCIDGAQHQGAARRSILQRCSSYKHSHFGGTSQVNASNGAACRFGPQTHHTYSRYLLSAAATHTLIATDDS